jgi:hypothetical protein
LFHQIDKVVDAVDGLEVFLVEVFFYVFDFSDFVFIEVLCQVFFVAFFDGLAKAQRAEFAKLSLNLNDVSG